MKMKIGDKVYLVQIVGGHLDILAGIIEEFASLRSNSSEEPDAAVVRYAMGQHEQHVLDTEWLDDLRASPEEARVLAAGMLAIRRKLLATELAQLEAIDPTTIPIRDNSDKDLGGLGLRCVLVRRHDTTGS